MLQTSVSTKYQVVIPKAVRRKIKVNPGQKLDVSTLGNKIMLTHKKEWPEDCYKELRGKLGIKNVQVFLDEERASWDEK